MMASGSIQILKPNVTQAEAIRTFTEGVSNVYWRLRSGPLRRIADAYVPYWLYCVRYSMGQARYPRFFAMDAVDGSLDLFEFAKPPEASQLLLVATRNHPQPLLEEARAADLFREKVLRVIFQQGFFKLRDLALEFHRQNGEIYLPYWLGFYGGKQVLRCRVLDAVRRRIEGAKAAAFFEHWLAA